MNTTPTSGAADLPEARLFTKKPVTISATQWFKNGDHPQVRAIAPSDDLFFTGMGGAMLTGREKYGVIGTLESPNHLVTPGDWIITGVAGEHYACKPDIFEATYSPAALAAGQATAAQAVVPAEWPTNGMIDAGRKAAASQGRLLGSGQSLWHVFRAMLAAAPAQPAAQQEAAYAALPTSNYAGRVSEEGFLIGTCPLYTADQLHAFADATHMLRASSGQAPAQPAGPCAICGSDEPFTGTCGSGDPRALCKQPTPTPHEAPATQQAGWTNADADAARLALELECLLMDTKDTAAVSKWWQSANEALELHRARLQEVQIYLTAQSADSVPALDRDRIREIFMAYGFTVKEGQTDLKQYVYDAADALLRAARAQADSVQEDAALWHWLAEYLVGTRTDLDDEIVASETVNDLRKLVKAAIKQGEKQ